MQQREEPQGTVRIGAAVAPALKAALTALAQKEDRSEAAVIRRALQSYLTQTDRRPKRQAL